jgi:hypothetical protein
MKRKLFISGLIILLLSTFHIHAQGAKNILLTVDTSTINANNVDEVSSFGQGPGVKNEDFTIDVVIGDLVIWRGDSSSSESDRVVITSIVHESGIKLFGKRRLTDSQTQGLIVGRIIEGSPGDMEKYRINFKVIRGTVESETFSIDPKIRVVAPGD